MAKQLYYEDIEIGSEVTPLKKIATTRMLVQWAGSSGDFNPLHHDETFAKTIGMDHVIAHGMFIMGIAGEAITSWIDNKYLRRFSVHFLSMTQPVNLDDFENTKSRATITVSGKVIEKYEENGDDYTGRI